MNGKISIHFSLIINNTRSLVDLLPHCLRDRVLLYLHSNGSNISRNIWSSETLSLTGFFCFIDPLAAQIAWDYLVNNRQIPPQNIWFIF